ncbi:hypothetical protein [Vibrio sagamiensis]|uniref:Secreted protein n=1 Tax=Vibrio sagamiensis NBRC 104589 TaxID=1219064 RepID=A0A511QE42_9VIBR|nr:hypothetical protein [Vibrio sagamiensis]PNQ54471.1 hypothetical protein C1141_15735 [Vibrio agarivorans]GEM75539.1 hypothetical protein VSA01S_16510 [Vibrio sagamiensis NBRC 104589]
MKKMLLTAFLIVLSSSSFAEEYRGVVKKINLYGGKWGNSHDGGILFTLEKMPSDTAYFRIDHKDIAFNSFLSTLLAVKHSRGTISVVYEVDTSENKYSPVRKIAIE